MRPFLLAAYAAWRKGPFLVRGRPHLEDTDRLMPKEIMRDPEGRTVMSEAIVACEPHTWGGSNPELAAAFGADLILIPAPGTVPGFTLENTRVSHRKCSLAMTALGTSHVGSMLIHRSMGKEGHWLRCR